MIGFREDSLNFAQEVEFQLIKNSYLKTYKRSLQLFAKKIIKRSLKNLKKQTVNPATTDELFHEMYICLKEGLYFISSGLNWT